MMKIRRQLISAGMGLLYFTISTAQPTVQMILFIALWASSLSANAQLPDTALRVHDPVLAKHGDTYYLFATGRGVSVWSSADMKSWKREPPVFAEPPEWTMQAVPTFRGHFWAPDISCHEGTYFLYYSVSAFGKNTSCIGLATNVTLDPRDPDFRWVDRGKIIRSYPGITHWNAIDPNVVEDDKGGAYLTFGSFWGGLKIARLTEDRTKIVGDTLELPTIASRGTKENPIEAPFIFRKNGYYYLFASIDYCCKGVESTYKMIVGRSRQVMGPYVDDQGKDLAEGGGMLLLQGDERWHGVGHNAAYTFYGVDYLIFHGYDGNDNGMSKLRIEKLDWDDGEWPILVRSTP